MALYAIGDLHLSLGTDKPMDKFPGWQNYVSRLEDNWRRLVGEQDTVVLVGDTSWAMQLNECRADFTFLQQLPGRKILLKGNHDYWWTTATKMRQFVEANNFENLMFLHNNFYLYNDICICGTRGWMMDASEELDVKVMNREVARLRMSLEAALQQPSEIERVVFLHYPPVSVDGVAQGLVDVLQEFGVRRCYYGHLHAAAIRWAVQGNVDGIEYRLISADSIGFAPRKIEAD